MNRAFWPKMHRLRDNSGRTGAFKACLSGCEGSAHADGAATFSRVAEKRSNAVILSIDSPVDAHDRRKLLPRGEPEQGNLGIVPITESPARAQFSSRGQRPRNSRRMIADPEGVALPLPHNPSLSGHHRDSTLSGSEHFVVALSGGVAPGYSMYPLRGSKMDSAEIVFGGAKGSRNNIPSA